MLRWIKRNASTILAITAATGTVLTGVFAARGATKLHEEKTKRFLELPPDDPESDSEMTFEEKAQMYISAYTPAIIVGTGTLICIFGANVLSKRQQASLISSYVMLQKTYADYRDKIVSICGPQADHAAQKAMDEDRRLREEDRPPWDEHQIFYMDAYGQFFERSMAEVHEAEYHINRNLALRGYVTLNEFLDFLHLEHVAVGDQLGWNLYDGEAFYGYQWIDFVHRYIETEDGMTVCQIEMPFEPHPEEPQDTEEFFVK